MRTCVVWQLPLPHLRRRRAALGSFARSSRLRVDESVKDAGNGYCCGGGGGGGGGEGGGGGSGGGGDGGGGGTPAHVVVALHGVAADDTSVVVNRDLHQPLSR